MTHPTKRKNSPKLERVVSSSQTIKRLYTRMIQIKGPTPEHLHRIRTPTNFYNSFNSYNLVHYVTLTDGGSDPGNQNSCLKQVTFLFCTSGDYSEQPNGLRNVAMQDCYTSICQAEAKVCWARFKTHS
jgi:hypothetical protein